MTLLTPCEMGSTAGYTRVWEGSVVDHKGYTKSHLGLNGMVVSFAMRFSVNSNF